MAQINFGGVTEEVVTRNEFTHPMALEALKNETIAVIGYGVQGPAQAMNLRDNGFHVIVGQRSPSPSWEKAIADGWVPTETLFSVDEACQKGTIIMFLLSDAGQIELWPTVREHLHEGKSLFFSHGFGVTYSEQTGIVPPKNVDVFLVAPKGSGTSVRRLFLQGKGINSSFAVYNDFSGRAREKAI
ncbi:MAG: ketol-acid reductoisomerase, partial [Bacteroidetes bacterium]|nr:ketol-acid reductoisomerase [Bacteroidota bacterium]